MKQLLLPTTISLRHFLNNYSIIDKSSISDIATLCTVSKSTISKFARSIGFEDYYELKNPQPLLKINTIST